MDYRLQYRVPLDAGMNQDLGTAMTPELVEEHARADMEETGLFDRFKTAVQNLVGKTVHVAVKPQDGEEANCAYTKQRGGSVFVFSPKKPWYVVKKFEIENLRDAWFFVALRVDFRSLAFPDCDESAAQTHLYVMHELETDPVSALTPILAPQ